MDARDEFVRLYVEVLDGLAAGACGLVESRVGLAIIRLANTQKPPRHLYRQTKFVEPIPHLPWTRTSGW